MTDEPMSLEELAEYDAETRRLTNEAEQRVAELEAEAARYSAEARDAKKAAKAELKALRGLIREREDNRGKRPAPTILDLIPAAPKWHGWPAKSLDLAPAILDKLAPVADLTAGELLREVMSFDPAEGPPFGMTIGECADVRMLLAKIGDEQPQPVPEDLWRAYPIERWTRFGLTSKDVDKLAAGEIKKETGRSPIVTVGDLSNFSAPGANGWTRKLADIKGIGAAGADRISEAEARFWKEWRDGGEEQFARERGLIRGDATTAGVGSEGAVTVSHGEDDPDGDDTDLYDGTVTE